MRLLAAFVGLALTANAPAAEVVATLVDGKLGVRIASLAYPDTLQKELTSGLTNRLHIRVSVADAREPLTQRIVEIAIRYDLWDEAFAVTTTPAGDSGKTQALANLAAVNAALATLELPRLFDSALLPQTSDLVLKVEVLLNPISRERMRMVRKWVAENNTPQIGGDQGVPVSNAIFNRIFEQYAMGADVAAVWRTESSSAPFKISDLSRNGR